MTEKNVKFDILIVEDHALTRFGLKTAFASQSYISNIYEAENGESAIKISKEYNPDIIILDLGLPDIDGIEVAKQIKSNDSSAKLIILTSHNTKEEVWSALSAGANAYCLKDIEPERLMQVVYFVYEGAAWLDPNIAQFVLNAIQSNDFASECNNSYKNNDTIQLTEREKEVLKLIVDGFNNADISKKLCVSIHTAKAHVCSILQKLSVEDRTQAAIKAIKTGIV